MRFLLGPLGRGTLLLRVNPTLAVNTKEFAVHPFKVDIFIINIILLTSLLLLLSISLLSGNFFEFLLPH